MTLVIAANPVDQHRPKDAPTSRQPDVPTSPIKYKVALSGTVLAHNHGAWQKVEIDIRQVPKVLDRDAIDSHDTSAVTDLNIGGKWTI